MERYGTFWNKLGHIGTFNHGTKAKKYDNKKSTIEKKVVGGVDEEEIRD